MKNIMGNVEELELKTFNLHIDENIFFNNLFYYLSMTICLSALLTKKSTNQGQICNFLDLKSNFLAVFCIAFDLSQYCFINYKKKIFIKKGTNNLIFFFCNLFEIY